PEVSPARKKTEGLLGTRAPASPRRGIARGLASHQASRRVRFHRGHRRERAALGHLIAFALRDRPRRWRRRRKGRDRRPARASARDARESQAHQARAKREKARVALEPMSEKSEVRGPKSEVERLLSLRLT